jgi:predicted DCC family thiol-disulfide oxidoreductase YuxK
MKTSAIHQNNDLNSPIVFFDGVCNLCNSAVQYILRHEMRNELLFCSLQSAAASEIFASRGLLKPEVDSIILLDRHQVYVKSEAALRIAKYLKWPHSWWYLFRVFPLWLRDGVYTFIARNRYKWFGKQAACIVPTPELMARFISD